MTTTELPPELYTNIQQIFRATPVLLMGSGFSCGYNLPSMAALGAHLIDVLGPKLVSTDAKTLWAESLDAIRNNLEDGLNTIANRASGRDEITALLREETAKFISDKTHEAETVIINHPSPADLAPARLLQRLFKGAPQNAECISVITTNYDTLIELFCDIAALPVDTGFSGFRRRKFRANPLFQTQYSRRVVMNKKGRTYEHPPCLTVRLHKPHGSITWNTTETGPIEVTNDYSAAPKAIIVPGPSKYEDALVSTLFDTIRSEMNSTLAKASALLCIGFGFNDIHLQGVIKTRLDAHMPTLILVRELTDSIRDLIKRYPHIIAFCSDGNGANCHYNGNVLHSTLPHWQLDDFLKTFVEAG